MKGHIQLRPARQEDAAALQCLNADVLGYDCSLSDTQKQLRRLLHMPQHLLVVAERKQELIGYVHAQDYDILYAAPMIDILGIAVHPDYQQQGIGSRLLAEVEQWAGKSECLYDSSCFRRVRTGAHAFYEARGYVREKRQLNFKKIIKKHEE